MTEHLWNSDGALVKATAEVDGETATGEAVDVLMHDLLLGYIEEMRDGSNAEINRA